MNEQTESGQDLVLTGKSGHTYAGKIYSDKECTTPLSTPAIVCIANSRNDEGTWQHSVRDIYDTDNIPETLQHFKERDDITHLILIPSDEGEPGEFDKIDDLRRNYIHK